MSVELIGTRNSSRTVLSELPALLSPENVGKTKDESAEAGFLCLISQVENQLTVWDLGGKTGTFVNGSRVTRATLKDSDTLGFGGSEFRVHADNPVKRYVYGPRN